MLNCLDIVLNSYCCKMVNDYSDKKENQLLLTANKSLLVS